MDVAINNNLCQSGFVSILPRVKMVVSHVTDMCPPAAILTSSNPYATNCQF